MITTLSDLYPTVSQKLPGISSAILNTEFKRAEREACRETGVWKAEYTFDTEEDTYEYSVDLPTNTDLVLSLRLDDGNDTKEDPNNYTVDFEVGTASDGYTLHSPVGSTQPYLEGQYENMSQVINGYNTYSNEDYVLFQTTEGTTTDATVHFILATIDDFETFVLEPTTLPDNYYESPTPLSSYTGAFLGVGAYAGSISSSALSAGAVCTYTLAEHLVHDPSENEVFIPETFTATLSLTPRVGYSSAPSNILTRYAELITEKALTRLYEYPPNFPWSNPAAAEQSRTRARKLVALAKNERYKGMRRTSVVVSAPYGFI